MGIKRLSVDRVADVAGIVGAVLSLIAVLQPLPEPYRIVLVVLLVPVGPWAVYRFWVKLKVLNDLRNKKTFAPRILLIGGTDCGQLMSEIKSHDRLLREPYIEFREVVVGGREKREQLHEKVSTAEGIILMPDFTRASHPEVYAWLEEWSGNLPQPIARYYPRDYVGRESKDFRIIPFHTASGVVEYASEFLLLRAVDRGRLLQTKIRLSYAIIAALCVFLIAGVVSGLLTERRMDAERSNLGAVERAAFTPPRIQQDIVAALKKFRSSLKKY